MAVNISGLDDATPYECTMNSAIRVGGQVWRPGIKVFATGEMLKSVVAANPAAANAFETATATERPLGDA